MSSPQYRRLIFKKTTQLHNTFFRITYARHRTCPTVAHHHRLWMMNPEHSLKFRKKGAISIQSILCLPTLKNITRNCRPDVEHFRLRQRISHK